jgi:hypothetical protein
MILTVMIVHTLRAMNIRKYVIVVKFVNVDLSCIVAENIRLREDIDELLAIKEELHEYFQE